jgi:hypothetical protein
LGSVGKSSILNREDTNERKDEIAWYLHSVPTTFIKTLQRCMSRSGKKGREHMQDEPSSYQIRLKGHLSPQWATYFDGFTLTNSENGEALLTGVITDQAALHGVLAKIRDLGLPLLSVNNIANGQARKEQE